LLIGYRLVSESCNFFRLVSPNTQTVAKSLTNPAATPSAPVYLLTKSADSGIRAGGSDTNTHRYRDLEVDD